jgi:predicted transposase/invertase (TIGR01784 family)
MICEEGIAMATNLTNEEKKEKLLKEIIAQDEGIAAADRVFRRICNGEVQPVRLPTLQKSELNYQRRMIEAKRRGHTESLQKGRAEGLAEGHAEKALEIARKMKNAGRPLSEIAEFTGLDIETLEQLR